MGGGGGEESSYFGVIEYGTPQIGRVCIPLPRWRLFGTLGTENKVFGCVINFNSTSNLARNVYDCRTRVGVGAFMLLSNVLDTNGEG